MTNIEYIIKAIDYIEAHLQDDLSVLEVSRQIGYSYYHFSRLFHGVTGHTPRDYIQKRRLTEAAREINASTRKITDIAFDYQYNDYETFNRMFKQAFHVNPSNLRKKQLNFCLPLLPRLQPENVYHFLNTRVNEPELVELGPISVVGIAALIQDKLGLITELWYRFFEMYNEVPDRIKPERFYQIGFWSNEVDLKGFFVMCGVEVAKVKGIPPSMVAKIIPASRYLRFIHKGRSDRVYLSYKYIFGTYLPQSEYRLSQPYEFEFCGPNFLGPENEDSETEIYIPIEQPFPIQV